MLAPRDITALILAGGFGTRIKDLLGDIPKPMAPVNGRPFVEWIVRWLKAQGVRDVILSTGFRAELVEKHFSTTPVSEMNVRCVAELEPLGTGGGLAHAAAESGSTPPAWLVLNGDSLIFADVAAIIDSLGDASGVERHGSCPFQLIVVLPGCDTLSSHTSMWVWGASVSGS